jgi:hypothetical protein
LRLFFFRKYFAIPLNLFEFLQSKHTKHIKSLKNLILIVKPNISVMKTKKVILGLMCITAGAFFLTQACTKDNEGTISSTDLSLAQDEAYVDALYEEVDNMVISEISALDENNYVNSGLKSTTDDICYTVTVDHPDTTTFPKVITIDFGDGCSLIFNDDTITRKGQIIVTITDRWFVPGASHSITFNNFSINDVKIEGTRTITNLGLNDQNHLEMSIVLENGKVTFNDTAWVTRNANHLREWIRHMDPMNDTILITGWASGINILGEEYTREITEPLVLVHCLNYRWRWVIVDGLITITNSVRGITTLDYGDGSCDSALMINKNGRHHRYEFRYHHRFHRGGN